MDRPPGAPLVAAFVLAQLAVLAAQPAPHVLGDLDVLRGIPPPPPMLIRPRAFAAYGAPLSVVFIDVNHFKRLNDTLGHDVGDQVLKAIGTLLRRQVRESDYVIRWGGDEFLLLLTCGLPDAERKADELAGAFERERRSAGLPEGIGLSIGVAPVPADAERLANTIRIADSRMYQKKLGERGALE